MKIFNLVLALMFLLFAFVQINDPDPVIWILIYGIMAVSCVLAAFRRYYPPATLVLLVIFAIYGLSYGPGLIEWMKSDNKWMLFSDIAKMEYSYIEESREFLGLLIAILVLLMHWVSSRRHE